MLRVLTIVGARPQFIKAAAVSRAILQSGGISEDILHTGQHYDDAMSESFFRDLQIPAPKINLEVGSGQHGEQTAKMLTGIERTILETKPDWLMVYGDTNSTLAGALAASKLHVPVAHVEAGLRSFNRKMPEEINRVLTDHASDLLFAPTATAVANLANEGMSGRHVVLSGDVMYDSALFAAGQSVSLDPRLKPGHYIAATVHRAENTDDPKLLRAILDGLVDTGMTVALPLHPRTRKCITEFGLQEILDSIVVLDPLPYLAMAQLVKDSAVVATDSGGLQKEAFFHGVPCVTLRTETEWVELVELGWNTVQEPSDQQSVTRAITRAIGTRGQAGKPYGEGRAAQTIVETLKSGRLALSIR